MQRPKHSLVSAKLVEEIVSMVACNLKAIFNHAFLQITDGYALQMVLYYARGNAKEFQFKPILFYKVCT